MRLAGAAALALVLLAVAPMPASAGGAYCLGGRPATYCAIAESLIDIDCEVAQGNYSCTIRADWRAGGATRGPGPGESVGPVWLNWGLCDGYSCEEFFGDVGVPCSWAAGGHGCVRQGQLLEHRSGPLSGCLLVYVSQDVDTHIRLPGTPLDVVTARDRPIVEENLC